MGLTNRLVLSYLTSVRGSSASTFAVPNRIDVEQQLPFPEIPVFGLSILLLVTIPQLSTP
jgi:hypothetical protein